MVLKRFVIMALGALGLGALAAGPTFAQGGQIPAPDAYGDPQACAASIKAVTAAADTGEVGDDGLTPTQRTALTNMANACAGDVGGGIGKARTLYQDVVEAKSDLDDAEKAYEDDDSARNKEDLGEATKAHMDAVADRNAYSGGSAIYEAVYAEEDRRAEATAAQSAWMKAFDKAGVARETRDMVEYEDYISEFAGFDSTGAALEFETVTYKTKDAVEAVGTIAAEPAEYKTFIRVKKQGGAVIGAVKNDSDEDIVPTTVYGVNEQGVSLGSLSVYNAEGDETTGVGLRTYTFDHDLDEATAPITIVAVGTQGDVVIDATSFRISNPGRTTEEGKVLMPQTMFRVFMDNNGDLEETGGIEFDYKNAKDGLDAARKAVEDNQDLTQNVPLAEIERKAQARYDFFAAQKASAEKQLAAGELKVERFGDDPQTTDQVETPESRAHSLGSTPYTVEEFEALTDLQDAADDAAAALKAAYDARVAATDDLETNQRDTQDYLDQLVKLREYEKAVADAAAPDDAEEPTAGQKTANDKLATAEAQLASFNELQALDDANPVKALVNSLLEAPDTDGDDDGQALVDAISSNYETANDAASTADDAETTANAAMDAVAGLSGEEGEVAGNAAAIAALTAEDDPDTDADETGPITENADGIVDLDGRVSGNENTLADHDMKLMAKKAYIDAIGAEMGFDAATGLGIGEDDMSRIDTNEAGVEANSTAITAETAARMEADTALDGRIDAEALAREAADIALDDRIDTEASAREMADTALGGRIDTEASAREMADTALGGRIDAEETARMAADTMLGGRIDAEEAARMSADVAEETARMAADSVEEAARMEADTMLHGMIGDESTARAAADDMVRGEFAAEDTAIRSELAAADSSIRSAFAAADTGLRGMINDNGARIGELSDDLDVVRAGVAASMALAGMPAINGRGISIGVGSFDGESAFAVGFQIQGEMASFKIGLTSGGGATGASAGVGFQF